MTATFNSSQTPLLSGRDPLQLPDADRTSIEPSITTLVPRSILTALAAILVAPTRATSSRPFLDSLIRDLAEGSWVTRAGIPAEPLIGAGPLDLPDRDPQQVDSVPHVTAARALTAVADLTAWLGVTEEQVADTAGFSRRNLSNWRAGSGTYPKTVRGLFEIHALLAALVRAIGTDRAASWLSLQSAMGSRRRELLASESGRAQLLSEAQHLLFAKARRETPRAEFEDEPLPATSRPHQSTAESLSTTPPHRSRRLE